MSAHAIKIRPQAGIDPEGCYKHKPTEPADIHCRGGIAVPAKEPTETCDCGCNVRVCRAHPEDRKDKCEDQHVSHRVSRSTVAVPFRKDAADSVLGRIAEELKRTRQCRVD